MLDWDIEKWVRCEALALAAGPRAPGISAAAVVEDLAQRAFMGESVDRPERVTLDSLTPERRDVLWQVTACLDAADTLLSASGWQASDPAEALPANPFPAVTMRRADGQMALVHLTTRTVVGSAWLKVGLWLEWLSADKGENAPGDIQLGGVVHAPRARVGATHESTFASRSARGLRHTAGAFIHRVAAVAEGRVEPVRRPGAHCAHCPVVCPVRMSTDGGGRAGS